MIISENKLPEGWLFRLEKECFFKKKKKDNENNNTNPPTKQKDYKVIAKCWWSAWDNLFAILYLRTSIQEVYLYAHIVSLNML